MENKNSPCFLQSPEQNDLKEETIMQELIDRVGISIFVQIIIECWNEVFIFLLLLALLIRIHSYQLNQCIIQSKLHISKEFVIFYIIILLYNMCGILSNLFSGSTTPLAKIMISVSLLSYYMINGFHNIFLLQVFKKYLAAKINMPFLKKGIVFFQLLQIFLMLTLSFTPFTDIFYRINERNEFTTYLWGGLVWNGINLLTFMFIGIVIFLKRREIDRPVRAIMLVIDIFPIICCINDFYNSLDLSNIIISVMTLMVFLLYDQNTTQFIIKNIHELENAKLLLAESRLSLEESKNQTLMAQIQPHFINNSLMALRARCAKYPDIYENITNFSMYLRSHFEALGDTKTISFEQEMTNIEAYLTLEQQNYKERLTVEYEIECDDFSIPALSVQPLVENAVRHGIGTYEEGGTVQINTYRKDGNIIIEVIDDGSGKNNITSQQSKRKGIGIENVRARLQSISNGELEIISREHGTMAKITIKEIK